MFRVIWDKKNNGVKLTSKTSDDNLGVAPRPVFYEELDLLGLDKFWSYPKCSEPLLWASDRKYFYCGELVMEVKGGNLYDAPEIILTDPLRKITLKPVNIDNLYKTNKDYMFLLENEAVQFINSTYLQYSKKAKKGASDIDVDFVELAEKQAKKIKESLAVVKQDCDSFDILPLDIANDEGKPIYYATNIDVFLASYSGGKDSQVLLDLVTRAIPSNDFVVIYSDTGYELPPSLEIYEETQLFYKSRYPNMKFFTARNHQNVLDYWEKMGTPSQKHRWCCSVMKTAPLYKLLKDIYGNGKQPNVLAYEGVRSEESPRRSQYSRIGKAVKHNGVINARPIFNWNSTEIYLYNFFHKLPFNKGYREGLGRVGCSICPYITQWTSFIVSQKYPKIIEPFINHIYSSTNLFGIESEKSKLEYIKSGNWRARAGGKTIDTGNTRIDIVSTTPDFKALITSPRESLFTWLSVLGDYKIVNKSNITNGEIKYGHKIFRFKVVDNVQNNSFTIEFEGIGKELLFQGHLKKVLFKTTYCVHCEVCEVECPTGALKVVPNVSLIKAKCIHCYKCLDFKDRGCVMANSINISEGNTNSNNMKTSGIDKYLKFGMNENWVTNFMADTELFFENQNHGLGTKMVPAALNWFRDAGILDRSSKKGSELGKLIKPHYINKSKTIWEIMWINLYYSSLIVNFYVDNIAFNRDYTKKEIMVLLQEKFPNMSEGTLNNPLGALCNMFGITTHTILGDEMKQGVIKAKGKSVEFINRYSDNDISNISIAYCLYKYAENKERYNLRISEFYDEKNNGGVYQLFGIDRSLFETILRSLNNDKNKILTAELNMGLEHISLREDISSLDVLRLML